MGGRRGQWKKEKNIYTGEGESEKEGQEFGRDVDRKELKWCQLCVEYGRGLQFQEFPISKESLLGSSMVKSYATGWKPTAYWFYLW